MFYQRKTLAQRNLSEYWEPMQNLETKIITTLLALEALAPTYNTMYGQFTHGLNKENSSRAKSTAYG